MVLSLKCRAMGRGTKLTTQDSEPPCSVSQFLDVILVHAEVMSDFMQHGQTYLFPEFVGIGEICPQRLGENRYFIGQRGRRKDRTVRQRRAFVDAVQCVYSRIEPHRPESVFAGPLLDDHLDVFQPVAKLLR
jgi:hypothetical protein